MNLKTFLASVVPHFERNRIIEDIDSLATDLESNLIPSYVAADKLFAGKKFGSHAGRTLEAMFHLRFKDERNKTHLQFITQTLPGLLETLKMVERLVPEIFGRDVTKDALTYKKAAVLQLLSVIRFYNDYAGRYLLRLLAAEDAAVKKAPEDTTLLPIDKKYFEENLETFLQAAHVLALPTSVIAERLGNMQDLQIVVDKINTISATLGTDTVDPLKLGFIGPAATNSPIYKLRSAIANYQVAKHKANQETAKAIQLRLFALKDAYAGKTDPKIQQQIEYNEGRLQRLKEEVASFEERFA